MNKIETIKDEIIYLKSKVNPINIIFSSYELNVNFHSDNAMLIECLKNHMYYNCRQGVIESEWSITAIENKNLYYKYRSDFEKFNIQLEYETLGTELNAESYKIIVPFETRSIILVQEEEKSIVIVGFDFRNMFIDTYKSIRSILTYLSFDAGWICLHSSAVTKGNKAILFSGNKGAGKTSSAFNAISSHRFDGFIGNDRIWCIPKDNYVNVAAWPTVATLGLGTILSIPGLIDKVNPSLTLDAGGIALLLHDYRLIPNDLRANYKEDMSTKVKQPLTPSEIKKIFSVKLVPEAKLDTLVFSELVPDIVEPSIKKLTDEEAYHAVKSNIMESLNNHPNWLGLKVHLKNIDIDSNAKRIVDNIPSIYQITLSTKDFNTDFNMIINKLL